MPNDEIRGLWTAEFGSNVGISGGGVAVFYDGNILGGDATYFYLGNYKLIGRDFTATLKISPFIEGAESVFKTKGQNLTLELKGSITAEGQAIGQGCLRDKPALKFGMKLTKRG